MHHAKVYSGLSVSIFAQRKIWKGTLSKALSLRSGVVGSDEERRDFTFHMMPFYTV